MSHAFRQTITHAVWLGLTYLALSSAAIGLTRFHGGVAFISVANSVLLARLLTLRNDHWGPSMIACAIAGTIATSLLGLGLVAALPMAAVNVGEAAISALLLDRVAARRGGLGSQAPLGWFLLSAGLLAPALSAFGGAALATILGSDSFGSNWLNWFAGHALGALTFTSVAIYTLRGDALKWFKASGAWLRAEAIAHLAIIVGVCVVVFAQSARPLLFLPMLPIMLATFRIGRLAAAVAVVILAAIGGAFTLAGYGPIGLIDASNGMRIQFVQFYVACTVLMVLPAAAELSRRSSLFRRLYDSEARYRLLTENSTDIVLNLDVNGQIRFASPAIRQIGGYAPEEVLGRSAAALADSADFARVAAAHLEALRNPTKTITVEFRARTALGELRWFETQTRAVTDDDGAVTGVVSAVRDVAHRKELEQRLEHAALTDKLTGIANRRAFDEQLDLTIDHAAEEGGGCVALFDLDHFKRVNDLHGHAAGDAVLKRFGDIARGRLREHDLLARYGGEEFAVILPGASLEQARIVCDRLRAAVSDAVTEMDGREIRVTVSGGVSQYDATSASRTVMADADAALYNAKLLGRDRLGMAA